MERYYYEIYDVKYEIYDRLLTSNRPIAETTALDVALDIVHALNKKDAFKKTTSAI